ncbi:hypothetical protein [Mesorhizobium sp. B2-3-12]|uniref:hypothetical protein n=1 Tax=Mesorhizobium sp. B2-3-12 TaxID=2589952 RepID=UPI0015E40232|nr:hypothetical protein [Mesorhizobium sp. B2-3-12]
MAPVAAANSSPTATTPVATAPAAIVAIVPMVATMPAAMRDLLQLDRLIPFEDRRIRLVQLIENSVALGNTCNRAAGSGYTSKRHCPRNAKQSSKKQPTFHKDLPSC